MGKAFVILTLLAAAVWLGGCIDGGGGIGGVRRPQDGVPGVDASDLSKYPGPFTVYCRKFMGPEQHEMVARHLRALERFGMPKGYSISEPGGTVLYYGTYTKHDSPLAKKDLETLRRFLYGDSRQKSFPVAGMAPIRRPPEDYFPLTKARKNALYSLMIAVFSGPQKEGRTFQESAVLLAKTLREKEKLEAYVHHASTSSAVCLGAYDTDAIYTERRIPSLSSDPRDLVRDKVTTEDLARRTKVVDLRARALQKKFPHMMVNGGRKARWTYRYVGGKWARRGFVTRTIFIEIPGRKVNRHGEIVIGRDHGIE